SGNGS
ncbi:methyltransferase, HemK family protein, partial [Vibrio parahaemolyticus AQ3810]